jgi:hypothetical protein
MAPRSYEDGRRQVGVTRTPDKGLSRVSAAPAGEGRARFVPGGARTTPPVSSFFGNVSFAVAKNRDEDRLRRWCPTTCLQVGPRTLCRSRISFRIEGDEADPQGPDHGSGYNVATDSRSTCMHVDVI